MDSLLRTSSRTPIAEGHVGDGQLRMLHVDVVADLCGVSKRTVYRWINSEGLPVHRIPGAGSRPILRISQADLDHWLAQHRLDASQVTDDGRTVRLDGRRFIVAGYPFEDEENDLDPVPTACSRVTGDKEGRSP